MSSLTIGVVIPCYKPHIELLKRVLDSIETQTKKPDMVIVSCSSSEESDIPYRQEDYTFPLKIYTHKEKRVTGQNKNFGAKIIGTDIISFFDADDIMHPQRIEIIHNLFTKYSSLRLLIHSLRILPNDLNFPVYDINNIGYEVDPFYICRWGYLQFKDNTDRCRTMGNVSIRKDVFNELQYSEERRPGEDTEFNRTIINRYPISGYVAYCPCELTWYYPSGTGGMDNS